MMSTTIDVSQFNQAMADAAQAVTEMTRAQSDLLAAMQDTTQQLTGPGTRATEQQTDAIEDNTTATAEEATARRALNELIARQRELVDKLNELNQELIDIQTRHGRGSAEEAQQLERINNLRRQQLLVDADVADAQRSLELSTRGVSTRVSLLSSVVGTAINVAKFQAGQLLAQYRSTGGLVESSSGVLQGLISNQVEAIKQGVSAAERTEIVNQHRQLFNAMGGSIAGFAEMEQSTKNFRILTLDNAEALRLSTAAAQTLAERGITPSADALSAYSTQMLDLRRLTGLNNEAAMQQLAAVTDDIDFQSTIRAARADERAELIRGKNALFLHNLALGMTKEQALGAAKALSSITAAKPVDRIKQAARVQAIGGALGISGGAEAAAAIRAGARRTSEQEAALSSYLSAITNTVDQSRMAGLGTELTVSTLVDKLDLEQIVGKGSSFSTSAAASLKPTNEALGNLTTAIGTQLGNIVDRLTLLIGTVEKSLGVSVPAALSGLAAAAASIAVGKASNRSGRSPSSTPAGGGTPSSNRPGLGKRLLRAGGAGAAGLGLGLAGEIASDAGFTGTGKFLDASGYAVSGAALGSILGPVGTVVGGLGGAAYGAYKNFFSDPTTAPAAEVATTSAAEAAETAARAQQSEVASSLRAIAGATPKNSENLTAIAGSLVAIQQLSARQLALMENAQRAPTAPTARQPIPRVGNPARVRGQYNYVG